MPKDLGGLGVLDLELMNISLLCKWLWKLENEEGVWQEILRKKYLSKQTLSQVESGPGNSQFWAGLLSVKKLFLDRCSRVLRSGSNTRFWEDIWYGEMSLQLKFPRLYTLTFSKQITVKQVIQSNGDCLCFRRTLWGELGEMRHELQLIISSTILVPGNDKLKWNLSEKGFSVKSMYNSLQTRRPKKVYKVVWKLKLPSKIKIFLWLVLWGRILTKDDLLKRGWSGDHHCLFCAGDETINHLFFHCPVARFVCGVIHIAFGLRSVPASLEQLGGWIGCFHGTELVVAKIVTAATVWTLENSQPSML